MSTPVNNLVYDVAHDLQTPLTALKAHLALIKHHRNHAHKIKLCNEIIDSMSSMVSDMLTYARAESQIDPRCFVRFNASARILNSIEYVADVARSCAVELSVQVQPGIVISGIPEKFDEVLLNLVSNAIKYLRAHGKRAVSIALTTSNGLCVLTVADTGIGIPANELPHVFTRFYRTQTATTHASGSGLGLAITKKIVELHGGTVSITSTEGVGTSVTVTLPRAASAFHHSQSDRPRDE